MRISHRSGWIFLGSVFLAALAVLATIPAGQACVSRDGQAPPWGGSSPNGVILAKIEAANRWAAANGLDAPPAPPISGTQPVVIILIQNSAGGAPFNPSFSNASLWSARLAAIADYYNQVSRGALRLVPAAETFGTANDGVIGPITVSALNSTSDISMSNSMSIAIAAIAAANPYINFASFDRNGDGTIEADELHILIYQAGDETSYGSSSKPRAWAHMRWQTPNLSGLTPSTDSDGVNITSYCYCGSTFNGSTMATMGQMTHELGHDIGLPDLYDADLKGSGGQWGGLGWHSLMSGGSWGGGDGSSPVHLDGFLKSVLGWADVTTVLAPGDRGVSLAAANGSNQIVRVNVPGSQQFFVLENRQYTGYDAGLPGPGTAGGLIIYHCDGAILTDNNIRISNAVNQSPTNPGIKVEQADGSDSLASANGWGSGLDYYRQGNNVLFDAFSNPNSKLKNGTQSGVSVNGIGASQSVMPFKIGNPTTAARGTWMLFK